jgi:hypothetical protein
MRRLLALTVLALACAGPPRTGDEILKELNRESPELQAMQRAEREKQERDAARAAELERADREKEESAAKAENAKKEAEQQESLERAQAQWAAQDALTESLQETCGKDYKRIQVGMRWKRVEECADQEFSTKYQDAHSTVYESESMAVRVEQGRVTRILNY